MTYPHPPRKVAGLGHTLCHTSSRDIHQLRVRSLRQMTPSKAPVSPAPFLISANTREEKRWQKKLKEEWEVSQGQRKLWVFWDSILQTELKFKPLGRIPPAATCVCVIVCRHSNNCGYCQLTSTMAVLCPAFHSPALHALTFTLLLLLFHDGPWACGEGDTDIILYGQALSSRLLSIPCPVMSPWLTPVCTQAQWSISDQGWEQHCGGLNRNAPMDSCVLSACHHRVWH